MHGGGEPGITRVNLSARIRLADAIKRIEAIPMGGTDCALPAQGRQDQVTTQAGVKAPACAFDFRPVGRAAEAVVCKTTHVGAIPTRDSIFSGIGVGRHTPLAVRSTFQNGVEGALPSCPSIFRDANIGYWLSVMRAAHCLVASSAVRRFLTPEDSEQNRARQPISAVQQRINTSMRRNVVTVCKHFMNDILNKSIVLVLNRNWQAINIRRCGVEAVHEGMKPRESGRQSSLSPLETNRIES